TWHTPRFSPRSGPFPSPQKRVSRCFSPCPVATTCKTSPFSQSEGSFLRSFPFPSRQTRVGGWFSGCPVTTTCKISPFSTARNSFFVAHPHRTCAHCYQCGLQSRWTNLSQWQLG